MEIHIKLNELLKSKGVSVVSLVEATGIARTSIHNYLSGKTKIDVVNLQKICDAAGINVPQLFDSNYESEKNYNELEDSLEKVEAELYYLAKTMELLKSKQIRSYYLKSVKSFLRNAYDVECDEDDNLMEAPEFEEFNDGTTKEEYEGIVEDYKNAEREIKIAESESNKINENLFNEIVKSIEYWVGIEREENEMYIKRIGQMACNAPIRRVGDPKMWVESTRLHGNKIAKAFLKKHQNQVDEYLKKASRGEV